MSHLMQPNSFHLGRCLLGGGCFMLGNGWRSSVLSPENQFFSAVTQLPLSSVP